MIYKITLIYLLCWIILYFITAKFALILIEFEHSKIKESKKDKAIKAVNFLKSITVIAMLPLSLLLVVSAFIFVWGQIYG